MTDEDLSADATSWHDNLIYGLHLEGPDPDAGNWNSNLILDIDHIVEWVCGTDGGVRFRVAPATLVFHHVTDLRIDIDFGGKDHRQTLNALSIAAISKQPVVAEGAAGDYEYYRWCIDLNLPQGGRITFGATAYTQTLRTEPVLIDQQRLPIKDRPHLMRHNAR